MQISDIIHTEKRDAKNIKQGVLKSQDKIVRNVCFYSLKTIKLGPVVSHYKFNHSEGAIMLNEHHNLITEFPEHKAEIHFLKENNHHFQKLLIKHHELDKKIRRAEEEVDFLCDENLEDLKKRRLKLRDELYEMIIKHKNG